MNIEFTDRVREMVTEILAQYETAGQGAPDEAATAQTASVAAGTVAAPNGDGIFSDLDEAVRAAVHAQRALLAMPLEARKKVIKAMRDAAIENARLLAAHTVDETGLGNVSDKTVKNTLAASETPGVEDLEPSVYTNEYGLTLVERAPYGVIGSIIPVTNPTSTVINNSIGMVAAGNSVVFNPHPSAARVSCEAIAVLNRAIVGAGGPSDLLCSVGTPTVQSATGLMNHASIAIMVVTGGPAVVKAAMASGKKVIAAGPGNPPCVVDESADIARAGRDIVNGAGFDHNIVCICEKVVIAVDSVAESLVRAMVANGAYLLNADQERKITELVVAETGGPGKEGIPNKKYIGQSAASIAADIGLTVPPATKVLLCEVGKNHPLVWTEQLMPVLPVVRLPNVDDCIDLAVECEHGFRHTAMMHSLNVEKLSKMARAMNCSLFVKNGPCYAGLAKGGAGFTSFTIASPTGEGLTRARSFTRERRCTLVDSFRIV